MKIILLYFLTATIFIGSTDRESAFRDIESRLAGIDGSHKTKDWEGIASALDAISWNASDAPAERQGWRDRKTLLWVRLIDKAQAQLDTFVAVPIYANPDPDKVAENDLNKEKAAAYGFFRSRVNWWVTLLRVHLGRQYSKNEADRLQMRSIIDNNVSSSFKTRISEVMQPIIK